MIKDKDCAIIGGTDVELLCFTTEIVLIISMLTFGNG